jgi:hypothetical protein
MLTASVLIVLPMSLCNRLDIGRSMEKNSKDARLGALFTLAITARMRQN